MKYLFYLLLLIAGPLAIAQPFQPYNLLKSHSADISTVRFDVNTQTLYSGDASGSLKVWDIHTGKVLWGIVAHKGLVTDISIGKKYIVSASHDGTCKIWGKNDLKLHHTIKNPSIMPYAHVAGNELTFARLDAQEQMVYFGGYNQKVLAYDIQSGQVTELFSNDKYGITCGIVSKNGQWLLFALGGQIQFYNIPRKKIDQSKIIGSHLDAQQFVCELSENKNNWLYWTFGGQAVQISQSTPLHRRSFQATPKTGSSEFIGAPSHQYFVTGNTESTVQIWDSKNLSKVQVLEGHTAAIKTFAFNSDGHFLATGGCDNDIRIWSLKNSKDDYLSSDIEKGDKFLLKKLSFEQSSYQLKNEAKKELDAVKRLMDKYPSLIIKLVGHTDNVGPSSKNELLAKRRVEASKNYLIDAGIDENRIQTISYGESQPIADNSTEAGRIKNRRVEMQVIDI